MSNRSNSTYSLWLVSGAETTAHRQLQATITELAERVEDAPVFGPHVTVVGGIDDERTALEETTRTLAARTAPLAFDGVRWSTTRHQCGFLSLVPTLELMEVHRSAREAISGSTAAYYPHLSLVYSEMDLTERRDFAQSIDTATLPGSITCQALALVDTTESESEWETVVAVPLSES
ncbi:2'-5' RNA ligase family protein [Halorubrum sp. SS7]|uniref:2'-5' RNA ligase family protein n=1 Tax=Halorubrum sp. SS7 TaxID=2518119 RepID=UPI0013051115|nr:2'-5' RNA ligase family protein [Halorubrum sp. SS7]